jgi:hypothetical protein
MLDIIVNVLMWFFLISGVLAWIVAGLGLWFYNMDRR